MSSVITEESSMVSNDWQSVANVRRLDEPLVFEPFLRPQVWGGDLLKRHLGKSFSGSEPIGESWEISGLVDHPSLVADGALAGQSLIDLWSTQSQELAGRLDPSPIFPLFIKWLDCQQLLSVQVHPNDAFARDVLGQVTGKSEAWVVVEAEPTARVYAGLKPGVTREDLMSRLSNGTVAECLHSFTPKVGDCISLPAGTIHSAGGGVVFAEVQQPCDVTFRLFDWNRLGLDGRPRTLHLDMAMQSMTWPQHPVSPVTPRPITLDSGASGESLLKTTSFELERYTISETWAQPYPGEMTICMVIDGTAILESSADASHRILKRGSTVLIPASANQVTWAATDADQPCCLLCIRQPTPSVG